MRYKNIKMLAVAATVGAAAMGEAWAIPLPLPPGGLTPLTPGTVGGALLGTVTDSFSNSLYSGVVQSWVYNDPAWASGLTFVYQVRLNANASGAVEEVHRLSTFGWQSFSTAVEQDTAAGDSGTNADRNAGPGGTVGFNLPQGFVEGENTALFIVRSDADGFQSGIGGVINGQTSNVDILSPDREVTVPDAGASAMLLGLGLFGLAGVRRYTR